MQEHHLILDDTKEGHYVIMSLPLNSKEDIYVWGTIEEVDPGFKSDNEYLQKRVDKFIQQQNREAIERYDREYGSLRCLFEDVDKTERIERKLFPESY